MDPKTNNNDLEYDYKIVEDSGEESQNPETEFKKKLADELRWLQMVCPEPPNIEVIESTCQSFGILKAVNPFLRKYEKNDIIKISLIGHIASKAREVDENRFQEISPYAYFHLAHYFVEPEDDGQEYAKFVKKMIS